jgi:hypothetical protein
MARLGTVKNHGFDASGHERLERLDAIADCPRCGDEVECWADTEAWTKERDGRWHHSEYGGALGTCGRCNLLIADCLSDGFQVFQLEAPKAAGPGGGR